jgi:hypothetical protein
MAHQGSSREGSQRRHGTLGAAPARAKAVPPRGFRTVDAKLVQNRFCLDIGDLARLACRRTGLNTKYGLVGDRIGALKFGQTQREFRFACQPRHQEAVFLR